MLGDIVPPERRSYLYARPAADGARFTIDGLIAALRDTGHPHLVDWRRDAAEYGLRYTTALLPIPEAVVPYAGAEAMAEWEAWKRQEMNEQSFLASEAFRSAGLPTTEAARCRPGEMARAAPGLQDRVRERASRLAEKGRATRPVTTSRRDREDERQ